MLFAEPSLSPLSTYKCIPCGAGNGAGNGAGEREDWEQAAAVPGMQGIASEHVSTVVANEDTGGIGNSYAVVEAGDARQVYLCVCFSRAYVCWLMTGSRCESGTDRCGLRDMFGSLYLLLCRRLTGSDSDEGVRWGME
jgi:hypothetical protein